MSTQPQPPHGSTTLRLKKIPLISPTPEFTQAASSAGAQLVAVTGASEFVGSYIVQELLKKGKYVRGIVPVNVNFQFLQKLPGALERLQLITVRDFHSKESAKRLEESFHGAHAVVHASPVGVQMRRMAALKPSSRVMDSVDAVVDAASASGSTVKRLIHLSQELSVFDPMKHPTGKSTVLGDEDWYDVAHNDRVASDYIAYAHTVAEMKLWSRATRPSIPFTVCSVIPTFVMGPVLSPVHISTAHPLRFLHGMMSGRFPELPSVPFSPIDVRDVASACVSLVDHGKVSGRVLLCPEDRTTTEFVKKCQTIYPRYPWPKEAGPAKWKLFDSDSDAKRLMKTFYFLNKARHGHRYQFNQERANEILKMSYRDVSGTLRESMDSLIQSACVNDLRIHIDSEDSD